MSSSRKPKIVIPDDGIVRAMEEAFGPPRRKSKSKPNSNSRPNHALAQANTAPQDVGRSQQANVAENQTVVNNTYNIGSPISPTSPALHSRETVQLLLHDPEVDSGGLGGAVIANNNVDADADADASQSDGFLAWVASIAISVISVLLYIPIGVFFNLVSYIGTKMVRHYLITLVLIIGLLVFSNPFSLLTGPTVEMKITISTWLPHLAGLYTSTRKTI